MRRDNAPWQAATAAALEWSEQGVPRSRLFGDVYYSSENGLAESRHVFLLGNALPRYEREGKSYLTVAIGCTGGQHRSVYMTERVARSLRGIHEPTGAHQTLLD